MKTTLRLLLVSAFALLISVPVALAQTPEVSVLPVGEPLDVGGTILQPGNYVIRVIPALGDRNRVQITSPDFTTIYATLLTIPHDLEPNEEVPTTRLVFFPATEGRPRALRTWFPPNTAMEAGHDIVYEESRATQLAVIANEPVPAYTGEITETTMVQTITPPPPVVTTTPAPVVEAPAPAPAPEPMISSQTEETTDTTPEMPETASNLPLIALIGLLSIGAAVAVRRFARQA